VRRSWSTWLARRHVARISGLIHLAADVTDAWRYPISGDTMRAAIRLGEFYAAHAMTAFDVMGAGPDLEGARAVHDWLTRTRPPEFTRRTAHRALQRKFKKSADLEPALTCLEEHGWIRPRPDPYGLPKAQTGYLTHPHLQEPGAQATKHAAEPC
jgi:hypothetical protein